MQAEAAGRRPDALAAARAQRAAAGLSLTKAYAAGIYKEVGKRPRGTKGRKHAQRCPRKEDAVERMPRRAKVDAQHKLAELRFGDAIWHEKYGSGIVSAVESSQLEVFWLGEPSLVGPPWCGPHVSAEEVTHDWELQAWYADVWEHDSDDEWEMSDV